MDKDSRWVEDANKSFWRTGRRRGQNIYATLRVSSDMELDVWIGKMDTDSLAKIVVESHNAALKQ